MSKYIGLDVGSKTIGIASSNGKVAQPLLTIKFTEWEFEEGIQKLTELLKIESPELLIIGYPKNMDGSIGERAEMVDYFIEGIKVYNSHFDDKNIIKIDERRTTKMAKAIMIEAGLRRDKQKQSKDSLAAQLILELYLDSEKNKI
ncbi:Holliday junction DNA helicase [Williamsoniiplasma somnilux]|uniref:Putative pre-16S rRNA nuclease n=1 Tax=Williamsoniiplasma somnilux TaxID=215578 RepID=A0A2K8P1Q1_9MOLU|nr:Holliday junction resolvase RuvX [Williamsoniiplasma somnilux]ATZ18941.1 Holliday junction DNA helicase [Williamsoniiplasma somnilux]